MGSCLVTRPSHTFPILYTQFASDFSTDYHMMMNSFLSLLTVVTLVPLAHSLSTVTPACAHCQPPTFPPGGRVLYLPHCVGGNLSTTVMQCARGKRYPVLTRVAVRSARSGVVWYSCLSAQKIRRLSTLISVRQSVQE